MMSLFLLTIRVPLPFPDMESELGIPEGFKPGVLVKACIILDSTQQHQAE
jgi:hypothetical protein